MSITRKHDHTLAFIKQSNNAAYLRQGVFGVLILFLYATISRARSPRPFRISSDQNTRWRLSFLHSTDKRQEFFVLPIFLIFPDTYLQEWTIAATRCGHARYCSETISQRSDTFYSHKLHQKTFLRCIIIACTCIFSYYI